MIRASSVLAIAQVLIPKGFPRIPGGYTEQNPHPGLCGRDASGRLEFQGFKTR